MGACSASRIVLSPHGIPRRAVLALLDVRRGTRRNGATSGLVVTTADVTTNDATCTDVIKRSASPSRPLRNSSLQLSRCWMAAVKLSAGNECPQPPGVKGAENVIVPSFTSNSANSQSVSVVSPPARRWQPEFTPDPQLSRLRVWNSRPTNPSAQMLNRGNWDLAQ